MFKLSSLKDLFGLIGSAHAAWPTVVVVGGLVLPFFLSLPSWTIGMLFFAAGLAAVLVAYRLRRRILYLPLVQASQQAFEQLDGTAWAAAAVRMHDQPSPQSTLEYMGQLLILDVPLYGTRPPSRVFKMIDPKLVKRGVIEENCETLRPNDPKDLPWTGLAVERRAVRRRIQEMRASDFTAPAPPDPNVVALTLPKIIVDKFSHLLTPVSKAIDSKDMLRKIVDTGGGELLVVNYLGGTTFQVGKEALNETHEPRELAFLEEAVSKLEDEGLLQICSANKEHSLYKVTAAGYRAVESGLA